LQDAGIVWASGHFQNWAIMLLVVTVVAVESIFRGAYFGKSVLRWCVMWVYVVGLLAILTYFVVFILRGALPVMVEDAALTDSGFFIIIAVHMALMFATGIIAEIRDSRANSKE